MNNTAKTELFESLWSRSPETLAVEITLGIAICSSSIFGNMLVRFAVYREKKLLTTSNCLVVSMAASDFLISFLCEPLSFAVIAGIQNNWTLGRFMCQFQGMLTMLLTTSSVFNVTLVAINRYLLVVRPTFYRAYFSQRLAYGAILMVWILSAVSGVTYLASGNRFQFHPGKLFCLIKFGSHFEIFWPILGAASLLIMVPCYVLVYQNTRKYDNKIFVIPRKGKDAPANLRPNIEEIKLTKTLLAVVLGFSLCWSVVIITDVVNFVTG